MQELARDISNYKEDIYFDEQERNKTEERLDLINSLKRKGVVQCLNKNSINSTWILVNNKI